MNKRSISALVALNVVLFAALVVVSLTPQPAQAQFVPRGEFAMIAGSVTGRANQKAIYLVDVKSARMIALMFRSSDNKFELIGSRDIAQDAGLVGERR